METLLSLMLFGSPQKDLTTIAAKKVTIDSFTAFCVQLGFDMKTAAGRKEALDAWKDVQGAM